ncbi:MAG: hypothetical protein CMJ83_06725 [Planctomycetes bacterium]|nr:hypothetical protein [Planctomycetota bacterium]
MATGERHRGRVLGLGLILPGVLLCAWALVEFGGISASWADDERARAGRLLVRIDEVVLRTLADLQPGHDGGLITLDERDRPTGPFVPAHDEVVPELPPRRSINVRTALELESSGRAAEAVIFFDHARTAGVALDGIAMLAWARALDAVDQRSRALDVLTSLMSLGDDQRIGALPVGLCAAMLAARIQRNAGAPDAIRSLAADVAAHRWPVTAAAAEPVAEWLVRQATRPRPELDGWQRLARVFASAERRSATIESLNTGDAWVQDRGDALLVAARSRAARAVAEAVEAIDTGGPHALRTGAPPADALATTHLAALDVSVAVVANGTLPSQRLASTARWLLLAALVAFLVGNLVAARLLKREAAVSALKSRFIDTVSHELRTPLASLLLKAEMLADGSVPDEKRGAYQATLLADAERLSDLVHGILDFSRIERGRETLQLRDVPARRLLADGLRAARSSIADARQRVRVVAPRSLPSLRVDPGVMGRALKNLIENAAKYAPEASEILVSAARENGHVTFHVEDRGPGVPADSRRDVFEPFRRLHRHGVPHVAGTGLGLALVERAAHAHGGTASVRDREGGGAVFEITLPLTSEATS